MGGDFPRQAAFSAAGQAADGDQHRRRWGQVFPGAEEVFPGAPGAAAAFGRIRQSRRLGRPDMGAHGGAHGQEQRQQGQTVEIAAVQGDAIEVTVEHEGRQTPVPPLVQVHKQEGKVVENVDPREGVVEFDGVEQGRRVFEQADVRQVQVAMTMAHPSAIPPRVQQGRQAILQLPGSVGQDIDIVRIEQAALGAAETGVIVVDDRADAGRPAMFPVDLRRAMKGLNAVGQAFHQAAVERPRVGQMSEQGAVGKPPHLDQPLDRVARTTQCQTPAPLIRNRHRAQVNRGCRTPVDGHLDFASAAARLKG